MEIGSFIELQLPNGMEYYSGNEINDINIVRLNSGRAAIWHAFRVTGCAAVWLPYYQCESVREFLIGKNVMVKYYHIDREFNPIDLCPQNNECVLLVNYFGIMSKERMKLISDMYCNVIIDNSQAFFAPPLDNCLNIYSARKFVGVPDGAYVIGRNANMYINEYPQGYSSDTSLFLLQRIEYGCQGKAYLSRSTNEKRIEREDASLMSKLTQTILDSIDYQYICGKRRENFNTACGLFDRMNLLDTKLYYGADCVPMVYPLLVEDDTVLQRLLEHKHYQGHWWHYLVYEMPEDSFEYHLSQYMVPLTIDQRYGKQELLHLRSVIDGTGETY